MEKVVCFAGHRLDIYNNGIEKQLKEILEKLINEGYTKFLNGYKGDFDKECASVLWELKKKYPHIKLVKVLSYYNPNKIYENQLDVLDEVFPEIDEVYPKQKITKRNEWMVEQCDVLVSHIINTFNSGAYKMFKYAQKLGKVIINF